MPHSLPFSTLVCNEDALHFVHGSDDDEGNVDEDEDNAMGTLWDDDEYIEILFNRESCSESRVFKDLANESSFKTARFDAIHWILETRSLFGFSSKTAYVAVAYLDKFFMHRTIENMKGKAWAVQLLSMACLSIAAKMEEHKVPLLSNFQLEYQFSTEAMQRMELLVLSTLQWRMLSITPFEYLTFFASKIKKNVEKGLILKASTFILASIKEMELLHHRPSIIAVSAVLAAMDQKLTQNAVESKMSIISSCGSLDTDEVYFCYSLMIQKSHKENSVSENGTISYATSRNKRRRLQ